LYICQYLPPDNYGILNENYDPEASNSVEANRLVEQQENQEPCVDPDPPFNGEPVAVAERENDDAAILGVIDVDDLKLELVVEDVDKSAKETKHDDGLGARPKVRQVKTDSTEEIRQGEGGQVRKVETEAERRHRIREEQKVRDKNLEYFDLNTIREIRERDLANIEKKKLAKQGKRDEGVRKNKDPDDLSISEYAEMSTAEQERWVEGYKRRKQIREGKTVEVEPSQVELFEVKNELMGKGLYLTSKFEEMKQKILDLKRKKK
jgi:hypothetical protein